MKNIPKICHMYWGGSSNMALMMVFTIYSFHRLNPDWKIIIYRTKQKDEELGNQVYVKDYTGDDYFYLVEDLDYVTIKTIDVADYGVNKDAHSILGSDIFRTNVLYREGGIYSDLDVIWLKPLSEFKNINAIGNPGDFETTVCYFNTFIGHHTMSNILSEPGGPFLASVIEDQKKIKPPYGHLAFSTQLLNDKYPGLGLILAKYPRILGLRYETFYPYSIFNLQRLYLENDIKPLYNKNVMCVHWFNGHDITKDYINGDGFNRHCSMTTILKGEGYI